MFRRCPRITGPFLRKRHRAGGSACAQWAVAQGWGLGMRAPAEHNTAGSKSGLLPPPWHGCGDCGSDRQSCSVRVSHGRDTPRLGWNPGLSGSQVVALSPPSPPCAGSAGDQASGHSLTTWKRRAGCSAGPGPLLAGSAREHTGGGPHLTPCWSCACKRMGSTGSG